MVVTDEMYIENLEEYINDENKIVTYKYLSKTLEVHVNQAKQMLFSFVDNERNKKDNDQLTVTYFISGFIENDDEKVHKMQIVPEEQLEASKYQFQQITSCHIYSVQKCKVKDTTALYGADYDLTKEHILKSNKFSAIKCTCAKPIADEELVKLRTVAQPTTIAPSFTKPKTDSVSTHNAVSNKTAVQPKKTAGIAGMFANAGKKKEEKKTSDTNGHSNKNGEADKNVETTNKSHKGKAGGGIANFFGNQAASKPKKPPEEKKNEVEIIDVEDTEKESTSTRSKPSSPVKRKASPSPKPTAKSKGRKKADDSDDDNSQQKKRRRIRDKVWSDSSDDEQGGDDNEMEIEEPIPEPPPPSPPAKDPTPKSSPVKPDSPSPVKQTSPTVHETTNENDKDSSKNSSGSSLSSTAKKRKRRKKMVSKTFVDDGGYMVTEKVWEDVSESASEGEDVIPPTPPVKPKSNAGKQKTPTKKVSPGKSSTKQMSMMSFFKKK